MCAFVKHGNLTGRPSYFHSQGRGKENLCISTCHESWERVALTGLRACSLMPPDSIEWVSQISTTELYTWCSGRDRCEWIVSSLYPEEDFYPFTFPSV